MKRPTKFRAWTDGLQKNSTHHKMIYMGDKDNTYSDFNDKLEYRPINALWGNCNDHIWMQYTGLKDKNGKEIYEGDIVSHRDLNKPADCIMYGITNIVLRKDTKFEVRREDCSFKPFSWFGINDDLEWEVIENIYENSELLETK